MIYSRGTLQVWTLCQILMFLASLPPPGITARILIVAAEWAKSDCAECTLTSYFSKASWIFVKATDIPCIENQSSILTRYN